MSQELTSTESANPGKGMQDPKSSDREDFTVLPNSTTTTLLALPLELRQEVYSYIFHEPHIDSFDETKTCHCGDGLSITSRNLYKDTRPLLYSHAKPRFIGFENCFRFLEDITDNVIHLRYLSITDKDSWLHSARLAELFTHKGVEGLLEFKFEVVSSSTEYQWGDRPPPVYTVWAEKHSRAEVYDMSLRVSKHPLAAVKGLRKLTVVGYPRSELEEAFFKVSRSIEELAQREGKEVRRWDVREDWEGTGSHEPLRRWTYCIEIVD